MSYCDLNTYLAVCVGVLGICQGVSMWRDFKTDKEHVFLHVENSKLAMERDSLRIEMSELRRASEAREKEKYNEYARATQGWTKQIRNLVVEKENLHRRLRDAGIPYES